MDSSLEKIKKLLKKAIGLDSSTVGEATIDKILTQRMRSCKIDELDDYYNFLQSNKSELDALLETSVIPETWFFRDCRPFDIMLDSIRKDLLNKPNKTCNILCIPCSTGEEPYSISMFLLDNELPESTFNIQAVDISYQSLEIARAGYYGSNSFRGKTAKEYVDKYFEADGSQNKIDAKVQRKVEFNRINILDKNTIPFKNKFDFILCRNLLIYFDVPTKQKAFLNMNDLLADDGTLFIGHSEFGSVPGKVFKAVKKGDTFCLIKVDPEEELKKAQQAKSVNKLIEKNKSFKKIVKPRPAPDKKAFSGAAIIKPKETKKEKIIIQVDGLLVEARKFADSGQFNEAEALCLKYIEEKGDHAESFFLLGLISEAAGKSDQADHLYRKALYLDPKHYETLVHLSFIVEQRGDVAAGKRLRDRAERSMKH
jgi:chemotaxis protein methyltransferase WspC